MSLEEPRGLLLALGAVLVAAIALLAWRQRRLGLASYPLLLELLEGLPALPASFRRRRRLQLAATLAAILCLALGASGPVVGDAGSRPVTALVVLDHRADWEDPRGRAAGWDGLLDAADALLGRLRRDDRVVLLRTDTGLLTRRAESPGAAARLARSQRPTDLAFEQGAFDDLLGLARAGVSPDAVFVLTPAPARWQAEAAAGVVVVGTPAAPRAPNLAIVAAEVEADLVQPERISIFCRVAGYAPQGHRGSLAATLEVLNNDRLVRSERVELVPDVPQALLLDDVRLEDGLLELRLLPRDHFPRDNRFLTPVRSTPFLRVQLVSAAADALSAALRATPGVSLAVSTPAAAAADPAAAVRVYESAQPPEGGAGNLLVVRPVASLPGLKFEGEVSNVRVVEAERAHPLLSGVSFDGLRLEQMPLLVPSVAWEVLATADGYPLVLLDRWSAGGRVAVLAFDPVASGWVYEPSFPILVANLVRWLAQGEGPARSSLEAGEYLPARGGSAAVTVTGPSGETVRSDAATPVRLTTAGRHRVGGGERAGEVMVNLVSEGTSRAMVADGDGAAGSPESTLFPRPTRIDLTGLLLTAGALLLVAGPLLQPRRVAGRIEQ